MGLLRLTKQWRPKNDSNILPHCKQYLFAKNKITCLWTSLIGRNTFYIFSCDRNNAMDILVAGRGEGGIL